MKKCLSLLIALSMILSIVVIPVATQAETVDIPEGATLIFAEDFESGYTENTNLLDASATTVDITNTATGKKVLMFNYQNTEKQTATVTAGPETFNTSKVLKLTSSQAKEDGYLEKYIYLNNGNAITRTAGTQLVVEYDIMVDSAGADFASNDSPLMSFATSTSGNFPFIATSWGGKNFAFRRGAYADASALQYKKDWYVVGSKAITAKTTLKYVVEQDLTDYDTTRYYADGDLLTATATGNKWATDWNTGKVVKDFICTKDGWYPINGYENTDAATEYPAKELTSVTYDAFKFLYSKLASKTAGTDLVVYLDNIKVYEIPAINFTGLNKAEGVNLSEGAVVNFDQPFNATVDTFKVSAKSADTWIEDAVTAVTLSSDKKSATVKFDVEKLPDDTEFKLWIDNGFSSEVDAVFYKDLDGVKEGEEFVELAEFSTLVPFTVVEKPESIDNVIPGDPRTFDIKFSAAVASVTATLEGNAVNVQLLDENTVARLSFAEVADGTLTVVATDKDGQTVTTTIPVTKAAGIKGDDIINDDISGLTLGADLLADATGTSYYNGNFGFNIAKRTVDAVAFDAEGNADKVEVVADPDATGAQGQVLKITDGTGGNTLAVNRMVNADKGNVDPRGKVLVIESKYYLPAQAKWASGDYANYNALATSANGQYVSAYQRGKTSDTRILYIGQGYYNTYPGGDTGIDGKYSRAEGTATLPTGQWVTITNVFDMVEDATVTRPDTVRTYVDGELIGATLKGTDAPTDPVYDLFPENYYGEYAYDPATGELTGELARTGQTVAAAKYSNLYGITTRANIPASADPYVYYVDDFKAYTADDFTAEVIGDTETYTPNQTVKILFNSIVEEAQLSELYVKNAAGEVVEDATFTLANGGYAVDVQLPESVSKGEVYTVVAPTTFHDVTYQPLKNNLDWTFDITIGEYVTFKGEVSTNAITGFSNGKTTKVTATFSKEIAGVAGITVTDAEGNAVTEGWTASLASDLKSISLDFTNLPTANYTVSFADVKAADGDALTNAADIAITITAKVDKIMLFEEDFEDETEANWLTAEYDTTRWGINTTADSDDFIGVAAAPEGAANITGNALRFYDPGKNSHLYAKALIRDAAGIDVETEYPGKVMVIEGNVWANYAADGTRIFQPSFVANKELTSYSMYAFKASSYKAIKFEGSYIQAGDARYTSASAYQNGVSGGLDMTQDGKIMVTLDENGDLDTMKLYSDGKQFVAAENTYLTDHALYGDTRYDFQVVDGNSMARNKAVNKGTVYGVAFDSYKADIYVDNLKIYLVDRFEIESIEGASTAFNAANDTVKFNFTNKVASLEDAQANIKLYDAAGTDVSDVMTLSLAEGGYQVVAKLNESAVGGNAEYKLVVSQSLKDEYGVGLAPVFKFYDYTSTGGTAEFNGKEYSWTVNNGTVGKFNPQLADFDKPYYGKTTKLWYASSEEALADGNTGTTYGMGSDFDADAYIYDKDAMNLVTVIKTTKSTSLYAEATQADVDGTNVSTTLTFVNPEDETLPVWYIVAAYGQYNEMIGCKAAALDIAKGSTDPIDVNFTTTSSDIQSIKVYVWNGYKTMIPYQDAEEIK